MLNRNVPTILLISKSEEIKTLFRNLLQSKKFPNIELVIRGNVLKKAVDHNIKVVFIDTDRFNLAKIQSSLRFLQKNYMAIPIFLIFANKMESTNPIEQLFRYGPFVVLQKPLTKDCVTSIIYKYASCLKDQSFNFRRYNNLILNEKFQYIIYNNCKVFLSQRQYLLLTILINKGPILKCEEIKALIEKETGQSISNAALRACIGRIRRKFKEATGLNLIVNEYGKGYYINI